MPHTVTSTANDMSTAPTPLATAPLARASGAHCTWHPAEAALSVCTRCGRQACEACTRSAVNGLPCCATPPVPRPANVSASLVDRFLAFLVDCGLVGLPLFVGMLLRELASESVTERWVGEPLAITGLAGTLAVVVYQLYLSVQTGQTVGKRLQGLRVVRTDGSRVSPARILVRHLTKVLVPVLSVPDTLKLLTGDQRALHDWIADTRVVEVSQEPRQTGPQR